MTTRQLIPLCLALMLGTAPVYAQSEAPPQKAPPAAPAGGAGKQSPESQAAGAQGETAAKKSPAAGAGNDSPFDYRPSEQISEDLPVSFPVDI